MEQTYLGLLPYDLQSGPLHYLSRPQYTFTKKEKTLILTQNGITLKLNFNRKAFIGEYSDPPVGGLERKTIHALRNLICGYLTKPSDELYQCIYVC